MAIVDWPTDRDFFPANFQVSADVPTSAWRSPYTGTRETVNHGADRILCIVSLPPCRAAAAARREALIGQLVSTGDTVRFPMFHRRQPRGTFGGSPTVSGAVAAGARSITVAGYTAPPNRLAYPIAIDNAAWIKTTGVTVTANYASAPDGLPGLADRVQYNGTGTSDNFRVYGSAGGDIAIPASGVQVVCSVYLTANTGTPTVLIANNLGNYTTCALNVTWQRFSVVGTGNGASVAQILLYSNTADNAAWDISMYGAQIETGATPTAFSIASLAAGDFIGVGGNLLQVAYAGATEGGAGLMTVPLARPVQKAISNGAAVSWDAPTGLWQLEAESMAFDYSAPVLQGGIALPFRQVIA